MTGCRVRLLVYFLISRIVLNASHLKESHLGIYPSVCVDGDAPSPICRIQGHGEEKNKGTGVSSAAQSRI